MAGGIHYVGVFLLFAAFALMLIVSVSTPIWKSVYFLSTASGTKLGMWGYCIAGSCSDKMYGYRLTLSGTSESVVTHWLTYALIANPIAAFILLLALLFGLGTNFCLGLMGSLLAFLGFLVTAVALAFDLGIAIEAKRRINATGQDQASIGKAIWFVVAAAGAALIASFLVCCTHTRRTKKNRNSTATIGNEDPYYANNNTSNAYDHNNMAETGTVGTHHTHEQTLHTGEPSRVYDESPTNMTENHAGAGAGHSWYNKKNANNTTAY